MTDTTDIEDRRRALLEARSAAAAKFERHKDATRGWAKLHGDEARAALAAIDAALERLEAEEASMNGMVLTATTTIRSAALAEACGLPGDVVPRGTPIPPDALACCRNGQAMLSAGTLAWRPPAPPRAEPRPATPAAAPHGVKPRDFLREAADALRPLLQRGVPPDQALDLIDRDMLQRATAEHVNRPGQPAGRRTTDGLRARLMELAS